MQGPSRKTAPLKDSERMALRKISRGYGLTNKFCESSGITPPTFRSLVKRGYALESTIEKVRRALMPEAATKEAVIKAVCVVLAVPESEVVKVGTEARRIAAYLLTEETTMSLSAIARELHYRDHSSVIKTNRDTENQMDVNKEFRALISRVRRAIERKND